METKPTIVFDPYSAEAATRRQNHVQEEYGGTGRAAPPAYVYSDSLLLHVKIALATDRPLLLRGPPGCGKSTVAEDIAVVLGFQYYEQVITSRMEARDLLWRFDAVARLGHAHGASGAGPNADYIVPGPVWWAFNPNTASVAGVKEARPNPTRVNRGWELTGAVVLLDEIDKADPDFPNDLLVPVGAKEFRVAETGQVVRAARPTLMIITTNEERDLPPAFLRRCIVHVLQKPGSEDLKSIVAAHFGDVDDALFTAILHQFEKISGEATSQFLREPGTAELLDTVRVCQSLGITPQSKEWEIVTRATMWKHASLERKMTGRARPPLGLGDLMTAVVTLGLGEEEARSAAIAMGLRPPPRPQTATLRGPESRDRPKRPVPTTTIDSRPAAELPLEPLTPPPGTQLILEQTGIDEQALPAFLQGVSALGEEAFSEKSVPLRLPSLFEPAWVRGLIVTLLSTETNDGAIDVSRLVALVSEGRAVTSLPQLGRFSLRRGAQVLVDESADMMPFSADATQVCATIRALAAGAPVVIVRSESGCPALGRGPGDGQSAGASADGIQSVSMVIHDDAEERPYRMPMRGVPIVAVTDLGLRSPDRAAEWLRFALGAQRAGCPLIALTPYPKSRWPRAVAKRIAIVPWDRSTRVSAVRREARGASRSVS